MKVFIVKGMVSTVFRIYVTIVPLTRIDLAHLNKVHRTLTTPGKGITLTTYLGNIDLYISTVSYSDTHFNCKIVFRNLEEALKERNYTIRRSETRKEGRGTPIAMRILTESQITLENIMIPVSISIVNYQDKHFNKKIVLEGLEESLSDYGLIIVSCETRENGEGTPLAVRIKI